MKLYDKHLKLKEIDCYSYGIDYEDGEPYWYLQTASKGYEDFEIISSKNMYIPLITGKIISFITRKKLIRW